MHEIHKIRNYYHQGYQKTIAISRTQYFLWGMKRYIVEYISKWMKFQQVKFEHQQPIGLFHPLPIPKWKLEIISMDFITGLPMIVKQHDFIMVVVDKLSKSSHFIPIKSTYKTNVIANIFMREIFGLHGFPKAIISYGDTKFLEQSFCKFRYTVEL